MKRSQFSLRCLLTVTAAVAALLALCKAPSSWQLGLLELALMMAVPAVCGTICLERRGYPRSFWLGMAVSTTVAEMVFFGLVLPIQNNQWQSISLLSWALAAMSENFRFVVLLWALSPVVGVVCLMARWVARGDTEPPAEA